MQVVQRIYWSPQAVLDFTIQGSAKILNQMMKMNQQPLLAELPRAHPTLQTLKLQCNPMYQISLTSEKWLLCWESWNHKLSDGCHNNKNNLNKKWYLRLHFVKLLTLLHLLFLKLCRTFYFFFSLKINFNYIRRHLAPNLTKLKRAFTLNFNNLALKRTQLNTINLYWFLEFFFNQFLPKKDYLTILHVN